MHIKPKRFIFVLYKSKQHTMNLIYALLITLTPVKTVQSQGRVIHISRTQVITLKAFKNADVNKALTLPGTMRNNDTADLMIQLLTAK